MSALKTTKMSRGSGGRHWRATNEAEYSLTIPASDLFLKHCSVMFGAVIRYRLTAKALFCLQEALIHLGHFILKLAYSILHFLRIHGHTVEFGDRFIPSANVRGEVSLLAFGTEAASQPKCQKSRRDRD